MSIRETGIVVEEKGSLVVVRAEESSNCSGCGAKDFCHGGGRGGEKTVEALNEAGARAGDRVVISVPSGDFLKAAFQVYMVPVIGILAGAAVAQLLFGSLPGPGREGLAAGAGGIAGAVGAILLVRTLRRRHPGRTDLQPRVERVL